MKQGESATVKEWVVPSVREIQDTLVEVGDKPAEFAGSREWIGCFEACLVLDHLFSVSLCMYHVTITSGLRTMFSYVYWVGCLHLYQYLLYAGGM